MLRNLCNQISRSKSLSHYYLKVGTVHLSSNIRKDITKFQSPPDNLLQNIKTASDTLQILDIVHQNNRSLTGQQAMQCLRSIFDHQKQGNLMLKNSEITNHPDFETICSKLKSQARALQLNDVIEALKIFSFLRVASSSKIVLMLLSLVRHQINEASLAHLVFLDMLLRKFERTSMVDALLVALPMLFQVQLNMKMDHENVRELTELLGFAVRNQLNQQSLMTIITALTLHGNSISPVEAANILKSICDINQYSVKYDKLVGNCFSVINQNIDALNFATIDYIMDKLVHIYSSRRKVFYNEEFLENCADLVIRENMGMHKAFIVLKKFNRFSFVNFQLLNYLLLELTHDPKFIETASPGFIITLVTGLSTANYMPPEWEIIKEHLLLNPIFKSQVIELPWLKFALEFMSIGGWNAELIQKLFDPEFLKKYFNRENNLLDHFELLKLYQIVKILKKDEYLGPWPSTDYLEKAQEMMIVNEMPIEAPLKYLFGNDSVLTKVTTRLGHFIDHVIIFDQENNLAEVDIDRENIVLEDLLEQGYKTVAITMPPITHYVHNLDRLKGIFELRLKALEKLSPTGLVHIKTWKNLSDSEKIPYLEQLVKNKLKT